MQSDVKNSLKKGDEELITSNRVKLENVVKAEYVEYDIKKEPKYECEVTTLNVDILKKEEQEP